MTAVEFDFDVDICDEKAYKKIKRRFTKVVVLLFSDSAERLGNRGVRVPGSTKLSIQTAELRRAGTTFLFHFVILRF